MSGGRDISLKLTSDEINEVLRIFKEIDLNHSGQLSRTEAEDALGQLGVDTFDLLDADKDGFVDLREWKRFMREVKREKGQQEFTGWCEQLETLLKDSATRRSNKLAKRKQFREQMGAAATAPPAQTKSSTLQQLTHRQTQAGLALFEHIDVDESQMISFGELKEASLDDKCWHMLDTDMNGDVGLREWLTFLRLTKRDRGSKGLNHWMVDMERNLTGDEGCGVHQALYEAEQKAKGGKAGAKAAGKTTLDTGLGMTDSASSKTAGKGQLNQKQRTLALAVFNSVDLDRGGFIEADEIESVCGREETVMLLLRIGITEPFKNTHISMHDWMTLMSIKKKESQTSEEFVEWLEELTEKAKVAAEQAKEEAKAAEEQEKRERQRLQSESHEKKDFEAMNLTEAQRTRAMALFAGIDDDGNGTLERHEMERACGEIALVDIDSVFGDDVNNDNRIDMGEWLKWLRAYKQENGNSEFHVLLDTIEKEGNLMRDEEGPPEPEYDDKAQKQLVANMFKYRLSQDQTDEANGLWLRLDQEMAGLVPWKQVVIKYIGDDLDGFSEEEQVAELTSARDSLILLSQNHRGDVTPDEWIRFFRRVKQEQGDDAVDAMCDRFHEVLADAPSAKKGSNYRVDTRINMHAARMAAQRKKKKKPLMRRDNNYPKTRPVVVPIKDSPKKALPSLSIYVYPNDGVHQGEYRQLVNVPTAGIEYNGHIFKGFAGLLKQASIVLSDDTIHRLWTLDGAELTAGAGATMFVRGKKGKLVSRWKPGMEVVAGGFEDFRPNDDRSLEAMGTYDRRTLALILGNKDAAGVDEDESDDDEGWFKGSSNH